MCHFARGCYASPIVADHAQTTEMHVRTRRSAASTTLRELLGLVVGCPPAAVRLVAGPRGKLGLDGPVGGRVGFNVAHSSALMLCSVAFDRDVGVDVERIDETADWKEIAARSFAPRSTSRS